MNDATPAGTIEARGSRLCKLELWRMPDGAVQARLLGMEAKLIETTCADAPEAKAAAKRLAEVAEWTLQGSAYLAEEATKLMPGDRAAEERQEAQTVDEDADEPQPKDK